MSKENDYRKIEGLLFSYPKIQIEIKNLRIDIEEIKDVIAIHGASDAPRASTPTYAFNSSVENEVIQREEKLPEKISRIEGMIRSKERQLQKIDNALLGLSKEDKEFIELRYWKDISLVELCDRYNMDKYGLYKMKNRIIGQLMCLI